mmetsp:Transcript_20500/g.46741  ORF Transcript_20500/g.46741 Transcript_20500/m.46741 type:complete len:200 (+) Transcript_20500:855-1454(+)
MRRSRRTTARSGSTTEGQASLQAAPASTCMHCRWRRQYAKSAHGAPRPSGAAPAASSRWSGGLLEAQRSCHKWPDRSGGTIRSAVVGSNGAASPFFVQRGLARALPCGLSGVQGPAARCRPRIQGSGGTAGACAHRRRRRDLSQERQHPTPPSPGVFHPRNTNRRPLAVVQRCGSARAPVLRAMASKSPGGPCAVRGLP